MSDKQNEVMMDCIDISENMSANLAQAMQCIFCAPFGGQLEKEIKKARSFICRELEREKEGRANWQYGHARDTDDAAIIVAGSLLPYLEINRQEYDTITKSALAILWADYHTVKGDVVGKTNRLKSIQIGKREIERFIKPQGWSYE